MIAFCSLSKSVGRTRHVIYRMTYQIVGCCLNCSLLTVEEQGSGVGVCDESTCRYGGVCEYDAEGSHGCMCNFNCEAVRLVLHFLCMISMDSEPKQIPTFIYNKL